MAVLYSPDADPLRVSYGADPRAADFLVGGMLAFMGLPSLRHGTLELLGWIDRFDAPL
jgi:hypothetical protein